MPTKDSYPAQLVFIEDSRGGKWRGRLLTRVDVIDVENHRRPLRPSQRPRFDVEQISEDKFGVIMQGGGRGGRRYRTYKSLDEAQKAGIRWAGRRFRVLREAA